MDEQTDELRATVIWMAEALQRLWQRDRQYLTLTCVTCNHGIEHHFDDEGCQFPKTIGAPHPLCDCPMFLAD